MTAFMEAALRRAKMLREWRTWAQHIARITREILPDAQVYVTRSTVRGDQVGRSDVDILIIPQNTPRKPIEKAKIKAVREKQTYHHTTHSKYTYLHPKKPNHT